MNTKSGTPGASVIAALVKRPEDVAVWKLTRTPAGGTPSPWSAASPSEMLDRNNTVTSETTPPAQVCMLISVLSQ